MPKKNGHYRCKKCKFSYRFNPGTFKVLDREAQAELRKCPGCEKKMEKVK